MDANYRLKVMSYDVSFNPRARDGREFVSHCNTTPFGVSIHAPVMDAKPFAPSIR